MSHLNLILSQLKCPKVPQRNTKVMKMALSRFLLIVLIFHMQHYATFFRRYGPTWSRRPRTWPTRRWWCRSLSTTCHRTCYRETRFYRNSTRSRPPELCGASPRRRSTAPWPSSSSSSQSRRPRTPWACSDWPRTSCSPLDGPTRPFGSTWTASREQYRAAKWPVSPVASSPNSLM